MFTKDCGQQGADEQETDSRCDTERQIAWKNVWENWTSEHWHRSQEWYTICHRAIGSIMFCVWRKALVILKTFYTTVTFYGSCFWCTVYPYTGDLHKTILCEPIYHELFITQPLLLMGSLVVLVFSWRRACSSVQMKGEKIFRSVPSCFFPQPSILSQMVTLIRCPVDSKLTIKPFSTHFSKLN